MLHWFLLAPSVVGNLTSVGQNDSAFYIFWNEPEFPNGRITNYTVVILNYSDNSTIIKRIAPMNYITINSDLLGK